MDVERAGAPRARADQRLALRGPLVERALAALSIDLGEATFGERVRRSLSFPVVRRAELDAALRDATAGRVGLADD